MAAHLLETPTITDRAWTDEPRLPRETRAAFIDAIAETPTDAEPIFTMTVVDDLLTRSR